MLVPASLSLAGIAIFTNGHPWRLVGTAWHGAPGTVPASPSRRLRHGPSTSVAGEFVHRGEEIEKKSRGGATCRSASGGRRRCAVANEWTTFVFGGDKIGGVVGLKKS